MAENKPEVAPPPKMVFQPVVDRFGIRQALVFGNHAPGGKCPYYAARCCHHCDIGEGEGAQFTAKANLKRLRWFATCYDEVLPVANHLVLYNSGSVLNPREMPTTLLEEILKFIRGMPSLKVLSLDSREAYIKPAKLDTVIAKMHDHQMLRINIGLETVDEEIRNQFLEKKMSDGELVRAFRAIADATAAYGKRRIGLDLNLIVGLPGTDPHTAIEDAEGTARFAFEVARDLDIDVGLNLNAYYPTKRGWEEFPLHPRCSLQTLARAVIAVGKVRSKMSPNAGLFIDWQDEGLDLEQSRRKAEVDEARELLKRFNQTQRVSVMASLAK